MLAQLRKHVAVDCQAEEQAQHIDCRLQERHWKSLFSVVKHHCQVEADKVLVINRIFIEAICPRLVLRVDLVVPKTLIPKQVQLEAGRAVDVNQNFDEQNGYLEHGFVVRTGRQHLHDLGQAQHSNQLEKGNYLQLL